MKKLLTALAAALVTASTVQAQIYSNGLPNGSNGNEMTSWIQADDFTLTTSTNVVGIRFWGIIGTGASYAGSISWRIYENNSGEPGSTVLHSGTFTGSGVGQGPVAIEGYTRYQFDIPTAFTLGAGTYWLGLHNGDYTNTARAEFYWETTDANETASGREDESPFDSGGWYNNGNEHAFELLGESSTSVPEPASISLLVVGIAGLGVAAKRRRA